MGEKDFSHVFDRFLVDIAQCGRKLGCMHIDSGEEIMPILVEHRATHDIQWEAIDLKASSPVRVAKRMNGVIKGKSQ